MQGSQGTRCAANLRYPSVFVRAGAVACGMHLVVLLLLALIVPGRVGLGIEAEPARDMLPPVSPALDEPTWVDLASPMGDLPDLPALPPSEDLASADHGSMIGRSQAAQLSIAPQNDLPAPDRGEGPGLALPPAFRRDSASLHARLTDGARRYRPEHERTRRTASSPDATRKEPRVGLGDLARTRNLPRPRAGQAAAPDATEQGEEDRQPTLGADQSSSQRIAGNDPVRGHGALDAEPGPRQFDVPAIGPAQDTRWVRAASDETHPGLMDLSAASAQAPGVQPRGPGEQAGAVDRATRGQAPSAPGADAVHRGAEDGHAATEQARVRYELEIRRRVARVLRFPQRLALQLEQGESIVSFSVGPDGRVQGEIRLIKSAGFEEFDREARAAILRAAPFPPTGRLYSFCMRVPFENPVVR